MNAQVSRCRLLTRRFVNKPKVDFWIDVSLLCVFVLVAVTAPTGDELHEIGGGVMIAIVVVHLIAHRKWIVAGVRRQLRG